MRAHRIEQRLETLEGRYRDRLQSPSRLIQCIVRKGHEAEDRAHALAEIGASVEAGDLVILMVSVTPEGRAHHAAFRPQALIMSR